MSKSKPKVIGIVGSRRRNTTSDYGALAIKLSEILQPGDRIVSGGCPTGGDQFAETLARKLGLTITIHHADWDGPLKKKAGLFRNSRIAVDCDVLIALPADDRTGGTEDTITKVRNLGKGVILV